MQARYIHVSGIVQGVGFRPFVYRIAKEHHLNGWVLNGEKDVEIHVEGSAENLESFLHALKTQHPPAAVISNIDVQMVELEHHSDFLIRESHKQNHPIVRISPDLAVCPNCLQELFDSKNRRYHYPYINCTDCGPRYSIITELPYDRLFTTMRDFEMCANCNAEYYNPLNRRFHAQPTACPVCGPKYALIHNVSTRGFSPLQTRPKNTPAILEGEESTLITNDVLKKTAQLLLEGHIVAIKGIGGYHLACDARNASSVKALRERKFRKEKPFALMAKNLETAHQLIELTPESETLLTSVARPIVLAKAKIELEHVSPDNSDLGVMLPYAPLHYLLFETGGPDVLVLTSANRSSEPIAYRDDEALESLENIADTFLIGERAIARRVDDSIVRVSPFGVQILRRARGYAPGSVTHLPTSKPILAIGADLKNSFTLVVNGEAFVSQHLGDLDKLEAFNAFTESIDDLLRMYELNIEDITVVHDLHPEYRSSQYAQQLSPKETLAVQHHQAHIASVLAEQQLFDKRVLGFSFDGTGYGTDEAIWGGEAFMGSLQTGFERIAHLKYASLVGGDAAAHHPVQAAAGFLQEFDDDFSALPFHFPERYQQAKQLLAKNFRIFPTSSMGRLFDTVAALLGFTRPQSFEGQAAIWLEHLARTSQSKDTYEFPFIGKEWDYRPLLESVISERKKNASVGDISRAFIRSLANGLISSALQLGEEYELETVVLSGGVFQNELLLHDIKALSESTHLHILVNHQVPCNDGGISLGQASLAAFKNTL